MTRRLAQPKVHAVERPQNSASGGLRIDWTNWLQTPNDGGDGDYTDMRDHDFDNLVCEWYSAAECELNSLFGHSERDTEVEYMGMGQEAREVECPIGSRRRGTADDGGLLGHRLSWTARGIHLVIRWVYDQTDSGQTNGNHQPMRRLVRAYGHRAVALLREKHLQEPSISDHPACVTLKKYLRLLGSLVRSQHRLPPLLDHGQENRLEDACEAFKQGEQELADTIGKLMEERRARRLKAVRMWAATASSKASHAATKIKETATAHSASADKHHLGETTAQRAADKGIIEWSTHWDATEQDHGDAILQRVERLIARGPSPQAITADGVYDSIPLPPIDDERIYKVSRRFRGDTGLGMDFMRPRHISFLSQAARAALARLLLAIERRRRWPYLLRSFAAFARAKKLGGSRLIGLANALYRLWARIRHEDTAEPLESRLARPYFAAAPGVGAERAVLTTSLFCEAARADGDTAATSTLDISKFYEQIEFDEMADGALAMGVPAEIILLTVHAYSGPRRIRVDNAWSSAVHPRRSIVAGCTWATVLIRAIAVGPTEKFLAEVNKCCTQWEVAVQFSQYIDDLIISTAGRADAVRIVHVIVTRMLINWMTGTMRKRLAGDKLVCIAPTRPLRQALRKDLGPSGFQVVGEGELLGIDFSAGGDLRRRKIQRKRVEKVKKRLHKIAWLARQRGRAKEVARAGAGPQLTYGAKIVGLPPKANYIRRKTQAAATRIRAAGSSLTAKLALGGDNWAEFDPMILEAAPPFTSLICALWDQPRLRCQFTSAWHKAKENMIGCSRKQRWSYIRGPVSAALAHLLDVEADWPSPFTVHLLGYDVCLVSTPPKQVIQILREHVRLQLDARLITRIAAATGADIELVTSRYKYGIDWEIIREALRNNQQRIERSEVRALEVVTTLAFWSEERRWHAGLLGEASCRACHAATGDNKHRLHTCDGAVQHCNWQVVQGRIRRQTQLHDDEELIPLTWHGLPPRVTCWRPVEGRSRQETTIAWTVGTYFGDGSGTRQQKRDQRRATAALWKPSDTEDGDDGGGYTRRAVTGWFPTSTRGELTAAIDFLDRAPAHSTFVGDCKYVIDGLQRGVPWRYRSSSFIDADLWRAARRAWDEKRGAFEFVKTKAHRSRQAAESEGAASLAHWEGNNKADELARGLCRTLQAEVNTDEETVRERFSDTLNQMAVAAGWALRHWPEAAGRHRQRSTKRTGTTSPYTNSVGQHTMRLRHGGGLECTDCRLRASTPSSVRSLRSKPCLGPVMQQCHKSHQMRWSAGVAWCGLCGRFTTRIPLSLRAECPRRPMSGAGKNILGRLRRGLPPTTAAYYGKVRDEAERDAEHLPLRPPTSATAITTSGAADGSVTRTTCDVIHEGSNEAEEHEPTTTQREVVHYHEVADQPMSTPPSSASAPARPHRALSSSQALRPAQAQRDASARGQIDTSSSLLHLGTEEGLRPRPRYRIRGKQCITGPGIERTAGAPTSAVDCSRTTASTPWSRRIGFVKLPTSYPCNSCASPTRTTCNLCRRSLCLFCAKARRLCKETD